MLQVTAKFTAHKGKEAELKTCLMGLIKACAHHKGMHTYRLHHNPKDPASFIFYEQFENEACLKEHGDSKEFAASAPTFQALSASIDIDVWNALAESGSSSVSLGDQRVAVTAKFIAHKGKEAELKTCLLGLVKACANHKGMHTYRLHQNTKDPAVFLFYEQFANEACLTEHAESPEFAANAPTFQALSASIDIDVWVPLTESGSCCS